MRISAYRGALNDTVEYYAPRWEEIDGEEPSLIELLGSADVTSANTAADTAAVNGVAASTVESNADTGAALTTDSSTVLHISSVENVELNEFTLGSIKVKDGYIHTNQKTTFASASTVEAGLYIGSNGQFAISDGVENVFEFDPTATSPVLAIKGAITADSGSIGGISIDSTKLYAGTGTWGNPNTGFYLDSSGKFSLKDSLTFDPSTGSLQVVGSIETDVLTVNEQFNLFGNTFFAHGVKDGAITADMLAGSAINLLQGSLAQSVGGSNGDFKEGTGTFTDSGGSIVLGTAGDLFDHGELGVELEANFSISWNSTTEYSTDTLTLQFQVSTDGTNYTNVGTSHSVTISKYDLSSYYPGDYYVYYSYTDITETISANDLTDNTDYYIRALITSVPDSVTGQTPSFTFSANEGVTGVTSTGGNADTLDNLDSTAFLRSNVNDTFDADLVITGNLTVQGTTTTINVADLTVADKDITLNYSTGDSSATANNAGIIIQDAVNSTTDASLLWKTASDTFQFSHKARVPDIEIDGTTLTSSNDLDSLNDGFYKWGSSKPTNAPTTYMVMYQMTDPNQKIQIAWGSSGSGKLYVRRADGGTFYAWAEMLTTASASSTYLPLAGGELTGGLTIDVDNVAGGALRIEANQTNPSQDFYFAQEIYSTLSGSQTFSGDKEQGGIYMDLNSTATGGDTSQEHRVYGAYLDVDSTGDADLVYGVYSNVTVTPSVGQTSSVYGGFFYAEDNGGAGAVSTLHGIQALAYSDNATSDVNTMYAGFFKAYNAADSGAIGTAAAVYGEIEIPAGSADIYGTSKVFEAQYDNNGTVAQTNTTYLYYGNYAGVQPTTAYGVYIADDVPNFFGGTISSGAITSSGVVTASGGNSGNWNTAYTVANAALPKAGGTMTGALVLNNTNISGVNAFSFYDPGPNEGISWANGNTAIFESPDDLTTNTAGNLQFVYGTTRRLTVNSSGIDVNGTISSGAITASRFIQNASSGSSFYAASFTRSGSGTTTPDIWGSEGTLVLGTSSSVESVGFSGANAQFYGTISSGAITARADTDALFVKSVTNQNAAEIAFSSQGPSTYAQIGRISYQHGDTLAYGGTDVFTISTTESAPRILADGLLMFKSGLALKPASGTGAGTTLITSGRALQNITTISSGAITAAGTITSTAVNQPNAQRITVTDSDPLTSRNGLYIDHNVTGNTALTTDITKRGIYVDMDVTSTGGNTTDEMRAYGIYADVRGTGDSDLRYGIYSYSETQHAAGTVTANYGIFAQAVSDDTGSGHTSSNYGGQFLAYGYGSGTGGTTNQYGVYTKVLLTGSNDKNTASATGVYAEIEVDNPGQAQTLSNAYVVRAEFDNDSGDNVTINNGYLYYGNYAGTLPTTAWGVYIVDAVRNFFAGSITTGIGSTTTAAYNFTSDLNTGMYSPANHEVALLVNGTQRLKVSTSGVTVTGNIDGVTDIYVADQIIHTGDTNTYMQFHAADQWRVVTGGTERLEVNNSAVKVGGQLILGTDDVATNTDANLTIKEGNAFAGIDVKSLRTSGNIGGLRSFNASNSIVNEFLFRVDGKANLVNSGGLMINSTVVIDGSRNITAGTIVASGNVTAYSDERLKDNIQTLDGSKVLEMRGVSFTKDGEAGSGVIAQQLELIAPELVHTADDEMGTKSVAYGNLVGYLIENAKQQQSEIDELKTLVKQLLEK